MGPIQAERATAAGARSQIYGVLAQAFTPPEAESFARLGSETLATTLQQAFSRLPPASDGPALQEAWEQARMELTRRPFSAYEAEFLRLFEIGLPQVPCPLYEGAYGPESRRREIMEEVLRFYTHFGLTLGLPPPELPDHLRVELEFLHYLTFLETQAIQAGHSAASLRRGQRDFQVRHLARWTPQVWARLGELGSAPFAAWATLAETFLRSDGKYLGGDLGS